MWKIIYDDTDRVTSPNIAGVIMGDPEHNNLDVCSRIGSVYVFDKRRVQIKLTSLAEPITSNHALAHEAQDQELRKKLHDLLVKQSRLQVIRYDYDSAQVWIRC